MNDSRTARSEFRRATAPFVVDAPAGGVDFRRADGMDVYLPTADADARGRSSALPAVVLVPGPSLPDDPPREWSLYQGYGRLAASRGIAAVVAAPDYPRRSAAPAAARELEEIVAHARRAPGVDGERIAVWAFSGGGLLVGQWLAESPAWLRCLILSYPLLHPLVETDGELPIPCEVVRPGRPLVLVQAGLERSDIQATVEAFLHTSADGGVEVEVIEVPDGAHAFDMMPPVSGAREAVLSAMDRLLGALASDPRGRV